MARAFIFPGQGSQAVGMGRALSEAFPQARAVFDEVDEALGQSLSTLMFEGPVEELTLTANAQPALMAASIATLRVLQATRGLDLVRDVAAVAGHSLGEYTALAAAGTFTLADTARLLRIRGEAMQGAVAPGAGAMAALIGADAELAGSVAVEASEGEVCDVANDNGAGQVVLSGAKAAVERAVAIAQARGIKRAVMLNVSAPFHCSLMVPAAEAMQDALTRVAMKPPLVPVYSNVLAAPVLEPAAIRQALVAQVTGTVRWRECIAAMAASGIDQFHEIGTGKVLSGLVKRIAPGATATPVGTPDDVAAFPTLS
ncbi:MULTISPECIES: ACP S-malonyltransferase [Methylobacterium]|uniref:Malonyl CoA-acyl carrier protein transacylase n=1 Tax=Methylobacterium bullatum TaxID=570505 RepID=A0AAV4Z4Y3_9HYPH|nr:MULTISPECIES: ACP S-malonyltransferase [Methylobacterium]KQP05758.1 ACP S-malonyltransferase [Methylobacterium sp. Leaf93]MBD8904554.1 malonyl CoA-acyl carrier protein transacylase [Methylobacterium bullatum]TXN24233.1 ACP S-malonyltransferase [Methylobacterium sp. WL19]GJD38574.1 Malonyl CoA-acyl carrier protein transacylase [Methylobacterium bullatum]